MPARTIAIGDVHGCSLALEVLIGEVAPGPDDLLITLGDIINRGPDTRGVIDRLIDLERRCRLVPLLGNHDEMLLEARSGRHPTTWIGMGGLATLDSYGKARALSLIPEAHFAFLGRCRDFFETDTHIFIHANYDSRLAMADQDRELLRWESLRETIPGPHRSGKTVIVGHSSQKNGEVLDLGYLKCIDTYCHGGGWLTALDVHSGKTWQANNRGELRRNRPAT